jgi:hypothetical protein
MENGDIATLSNYIELCEQHEVDPPKCFLVSVNCVWVSRLHVLGHQVLYNGWKDEHEHLSSSLLCLQMKQKFEGGDVECN